ncbi:hypothetical protein A7X83_06085 [Stenotrophomonas maltophilia]|uniref:Uncharacterized protein n=1 Tax=Stenotrophomonas maltophilia TaxID=40324 RepID=A0A2W6ICF0_STEMA|nr:hypothetical protein A7X83_06085 [Stenotrophomonas maltophilia]
MLGKTVNHLLKRLQKWFGHTRRTCFFQRREPVIASQICVGTEFQQCVHDVVIARHRRGVERRTSMTVPQVWIGTIGQQNASL